MTGRRKVQRHGEPPQRDSQILLADDAAIYLAIVALRALTPRRSCPSWNVRLYNALRKKTARNPPTTFRRVHPTGSCLTGYLQREQRRKEERKKEREKAKRAGGNTVVISREQRGRSSERRREENGKGEGGREKEHIKRARHWSGSLETRWRRGQPRPGATSCIGMRTRNESSR